MSRRDDQALAAVVAWIGGRPRLSTDVRNWTLCAIKNWTPGLNGCPEIRSGWLVQVVHRRGPRAA